jgi:hypothetical protein
MLTDERVEEVEAIRWMPVGIFDWLMIASGFAVLVGSFLPWGAVSPPGPIDITTLGTEADGLLTAMLGGGMIACAFLSTQLWRQSLSMAYGVLSLATMAIALVNLLDIERVVGTVSFVESTSIGFGLWLVLAGAVVGFLALIAGRMRPQPTG